MSLGDQLAGLLGIGSAIGGGLLVGDAMDRLSDIGEQAQTGAGEIAQAGVEQTQFQPFTVTTATGGSFGYDPETGEAVTTLGEQGQAAQDALFGNAQAMLTGTPAGMTAQQAAAQQMLAGGQQMFGQTPGQQAFMQGQQMLGQTPFGMQGIQDSSGQAFGLGNQFMQQAGMGTADRESAIYDRIRAMQAPGEERAAMELEERLASQGRLGIQTNQYGGTPEQLAQAKAQAEAQNSAAYQAIQQAQSEQAQQAALGAQYAGLGAGLAGQGQQLGAAQQAQALQAMQSGQGMNLANQQAAQQAMLAGQGMYTGALGQQQMQQGMGLQALQGAYIPQREIQAAQQAAQLFPQLQQRGQLYGAGLFGEASMGGLEAMLGAELGRANLLGELGSGLLGGALGGTDSFLGQFLGGLG